MDASAPEPERICLVGLGYIGLPTAAILASRKKQVIGVDINEHAVATINRGEVHIVEPHLEAVVRTAVEDGFLRATTTPEPADAFLIAVPTPFDDGFRPDLSYIERAAAAIAPALSRGNTVILESTSPVGATERLADWLRAARPDLAVPTRAGGESDIHIAYCPERVLPGAVLHELVHNDRVIGGLTPACARAARAIYNIFVTADCILTDARTAELCKLSENSFRDVNIAFANELSVICGRLGINVWDLIRLANRHPRVNILQPGPGVGGHCIAVDPWFIVDSCPEEARLIRAAREVNDAKPHWVLAQVETALARWRDANPAGEAVIACYGLAFKANIDDLRESPSVEIVAELARRHRGRVLVVEPHIESLPAKLASGRVELTDLTNAAAEADLHLLLVDHDIFKTIAAPGDAGRIVDTRGIWTGPVTTATA